MSELEQVTKAEESKYVQEIKDFCRKTVNGLHLPEHPDKVLYLQDYGGSHFTIGLKQGPVGYSKMSVYMPYEFILGVTGSMVPVYEQKELKGYYPLLMVSYYRNAIDTLGNKFRQDLQEEFSPERFVLYLNALGTY